MTETEHLLVCLAEECAEIQHAVGKALRFGPQDDFKATTPAENIARECCDMIAVIEMLEEAGVIEKTGSIQAIEQKKARVRHYMEYARAHGALT